MTKKDYIRAAMIVFAYSSGQIEPTSDQIRQWQIGEYRAAWPDIMKAFIAFFSVDPRFDRNTFEHWCVFGKAPRKDA